MSGVKNDVLTRRFHFELIRIRALPGVFTSELRQRCNGFPPANLPAARRLQPLCATGRHGESTSRIPCAFHPSAQSSPEIRSPEERCPSTHRRLPQAFLLYP